MGLLRARHSLLAQLCAAWVGGLRLFHSPVHAELRYHFPGKRTVSAHFFPPLPARPPTTLLRREVASGYREPMVGRGLLTLLLLLGSLGLVPLAYADPPDTIWLAGVYDDGDFDDVVLTIMALTAIRESPPVRVERAVQWIAVAPPLEQPPPPSRSIRLAPSRAPPAS